jgi:NADPH:quinone reductase-like Zn-dependent oxidoreductase
MRAARVHAWGSAPVLEHVADPSPGPGETVVAVSAAPVGHFDLKVARGQYEPRPRLPYVPGTDGAGTVLASHGGTYEVGAPVRIRGGGLGLRRDGTWAERVAVPDDALEPMPAGVDPAVAASFSVPGSAAYTAVHLVGRVQPGERVAVTGAAGAVGSIASQLARRAGAATVFGIVSQPGKAASVPAGVTPVVGRGGSVVDELRADGDGVDLLVDTVGGADLSVLVGAVAPGGRVVLVGDVGGPTVTFDLPALIDRDISLLPLNLFRLPDRTREAAAAVLEHLRDGDVHLPVSRYRLVDLTAAVTDLTEGRTVGRVVLLPAGDREEGGR